VAKFSVQSMDTTFALHQGSCSNDGNGDLSNVKMCKICLYQH